MTSVHQLIVGNYEQELSGDGDWFTACGSVTLVQDPPAGVVLLVDTAGSSDKQNLIDGLSNVGLTPDGITHVVCTHGHSDHVGNLNLFDKAHILLDHDLSIGNRYKSVEFDPESGYAISDAISVFHLPGHTHHDLTVVVKHALNLPNVGKLGTTVAVAGDIFENDSNDNEWRANSWNEQLQQKSRSFIMKTAEWIIPGHGTIFMVPKT